MIKIALTRMEENYIFYLVHMDDLVLFPLLTGDKVGDVIETFNHLSYCRVIRLPFWRSAHVAAWVVYTYNISGLKCFDRMHTLL